MKANPLIILLALSAVTACSKPVSFADEALDYCVRKTLQAQEHLGTDYLSSPRNIAPGDSLWACRPVAEDNWTMGFWPGILWSGTRVPVSFSCLLSFSPAAP